MAQVGFPGCVPLPAFYRDADGLRLSWNPAWRELSAQGESPSESVAHRFCLGSTLRWEKYNGLEFHYITGFLLKNTTQASLIKHGLCGHKYLVQAH